MAEFLVTSKKEIPAVDADIAMANITIELYLEVFRKNEPIEICNIDTLEGLSSDAQVLCFGFTKNGSPVTSMDQYDQIDFHIAGSKSSQAFITPDFTRGIRFTDAKRQVTILKGWNAIAYRAGCSPEKCREEIQKLLDSGVNRRIYLRHLHNLIGMDSAGAEAANIKDPVIFSAQDWIRHPLDLDSGWNHVLLKKLGSRWRILTPDLKASLEAKRNAKLSKEYAEI